MKTLQLPSTYSTQLILQNTTSPTSNQPPNEFSPLEIAVIKMLVALKKEKLLRQQKMIAAKDTGMQLITLMQLTPLTKA
jgi:hypothetical protein